MLDLNVSEFEVATRKFITPGLVDGYFLGGPLMAYHKNDRIRLFPGGTEIQDNFLFKPMIGGAYKRGGNAFNTTRRVTKAAIKYGLKLYYVNITEFLEDLEIELATPEAVFSTVKVDMQNASLTLSEILEIALMHHGQDATAAGGDDRSAEINGIPEALNDGENGSWEGLTFPYYGGQLRSAVAPALTPPTGLFLPNINGALTNRVLEHTYLSCVVGSEHPKVGITTLRAYGFLNEHYMPMQRAGVDTVEPEIGYSGIKFKNAVIIPSNYMPGAGGEVRETGSFLTGTGLAPAGETFIWYNPGPQGEDSYVRLWMPKSKKFQFWFTGWKPVVDGPQLSGQILVAVQYVDRSPRLSLILHGINA